MATGQESQSTSPLVYPFELILELTPNLADFSGLTILNFPQIKWESDINSFFAYSVLNLNDPVGMILDELLFIEGLIFRIKFGKRDYGFFDHKYTWSENQMLDARPGKHISGINKLILISAEYLKDLPVSKAWRGQTISAIAQSIATNVFGIPIAKQHITTTMGTPDVPQMNEKSSSYLKRLARIACGSSNNKSPFYTFINDQGEFYFMNLDELIRQDSVFDYEFNLNLTMSTEVRYVKGYTFLQGGLPVNYDNYKNKVYVIDNQGNYVSQEPTLANFFVKKTNNEKILIRRSNVSSVTNVHNFGIEETTADQYVTKGKIASLYRTSAISYRMQIISQFNPKVYTGKCINVSVDSVMQQKRIAAQYCGKWLIIADELVSSNTGQPWQLLTLAKSAMPISSNHRITDFL